MMDVTGTASRTRHGLDRPPKEQVGARFHSAALQNDLQTSRALGAIRTTLHPAACLQTLPVPSGVWPSEYSGDFTKVTRRGPRVCASELIQ